MFFVLFISVLSGPLFSDVTGYRQGIGTLGIFPDLDVTEVSIQFGVRNLYGISGTFLSSASYNSPQLSVETSILSLASYYRTASVTFAIRHQSHTALSAGLSFTFLKQLIPYNKNRICFALSSGIHPLPHVSLHSAIYGIPERTRIPFMVHIITAAGKTGILIEGEKNLQLKLLLFQSFKLSNMVETYMSFSTSPEKLGIGIILSHNKLRIVPFSEIHDILGQSGGLIVEYAPFKSYN